MEGTELHMTHLQNGNEIPPCPPTPDIHFQPPGKEKTADRHSADSSGLWSFSNPVFAYALTHILPLQEIRSFKTQPI
jgi:hypothetical protein